MRDKKRDQDYWLKKIAITNVLHAEWKEKLKTEIVDEERLKRRKGILAGDFWSLLIYNYNLGTPIEEIISYYREYVKRKRELWEPKEELMNWKRKIIPQYDLGTYDLMLRLLSWGILVNIEDQIFNSIVEMIDVDGVIDKTYELLIRFRKPDRTTNFEESYVDNFALMKSLRKLIDIDDKTEQEKLMKKHLQGEWYKDRKRGGVILTSKGEEGDGYNGYWSWESAAVTVALGLDDSDFKDNEYYPKDLVNYYYSK